MATGGEKKKGLGVFWYFNLFPSGEAVLPNGTQLHL
jgi:hypothetical protein